MHALLRAHVRARRGERACTQFARADSRVICAPGGPPPAPAKPAARFNASAMNMLSMRRARVCMHCANGRPVNSCLTAFNPTILARPLCGDQYACTPRHPCTLPTYNGRRTLCAGSSLHHEQGGFVHMYAFVTGTRTHATYPDASLRARSGALRTVKQHQSNAADWLST